MADNYLSNAQLAANVDDLIQKWTLRERQYADWLAGIPTGGPNGDGKYPLTNGDGETYLVECPAKMRQTILSAADGTALVEILAARDAAFAHATSASNQAGIANTAKVDAVEARDLAKLYRDQAAASSAGIPSMISTGIAQANLPQQVGSAIAAANIPGQVADAIGNIDLPDLLTSAAVKDISEFYADETSTDSDALAAFAAQINTIGDCRLTFERTRGRGPSGRFIIDREIVFDTSVRLEIDFGKTTVRFTTPTACLRYKALQQTNNSVAANPAFFIVRGGVVQYAGTVDCLFWWDFPYMPSRAMGTGFAADMRIIPQTSTDKATTIFRTKNTWYFSTHRVHAMENLQSATTPYAGTTFIEQRGLCVVTMIDKTEVFNVDKCIKPGFAAMVGVEGTFGSNFYSRGKGLRQGTKVAYFGRSDGGYGYTYSLYDETGGQLTTGPCEVIDGPTGAVLGSFTITSIGRYTQVSEAVQVYGGSTFVNVNAFAQFTLPADANGIKCLDWTFTDCHIAFFQNFLKGGFATLNVGVTTNAQPLLANSVCFDLDGCDMATILGVVATTNGLANCTFAKLRNITGGVFSGNNLFLFAVPFDTDNTVKDTRITNNAGYLCGTIVNTGNRYNGVSSRGIIFKSNGNMGVGVDQDDGRRITWTPTVTSQSGSIAAYTVNHAYYVLANGILTFSIKVTVTNRGTASGDMYISMPKFPSAAGPVDADYTFLAHGNVANSVVATVYEPNGRLRVGGSASNSGNDAFKISDVAGNFVYQAQGAVPVHFN